MKYSVIVPVYNGEDYIQECIESVINQNRDDVELILVNDGSTDRTSEICKSFSSDNVKIIDKENSGLLDTWIFGVKRSSGEFICFLDADDLLERDYFNSIDEYVEKYDLVIFDFYRLYRDKRIPMRINGMSYGEQDEKTLNMLKKDYYSNYKMFSFYRWDKVVRAEIIKKNIEKIKSRVTCFEDLLIGLLNLLECKNIYYLDKRLYSYRMRKQSVAHNISPQIFSDNIMVEKESINIAKMYNLDDGAIHSMHVYFLFQYARWAMKSKEKPDRVRVTLGDIMKISDTPKKLTLLFYKLHMDKVFNLLNNKKKEKYAEGEYF